MRASSGTDLARAHADGRSQLGRSVEGGRSDPDLSFSWSGDSQCLLLSVRVLDVARLWPGDVDLWPPRPIDDCIISTCGSPRRDVAEPLVAMGSGTHTVWRGSEWLLS